MATDLSEKAAMLVSRLDEFGISRLAETTGLDRLGVPTYSCVKPGTLDAIFVYSGKGLTHDQSRISAVMECLERTSALWNSELIVTLPMAGELSEATLWGPERFTEFAVDVQTAEVSAWIVATTLRDRRAVWVPADVVFTGLRPVEAPDAWCSATSNGLGAGFDLDTAIEKALSEIIERDSVSCIELKSAHYSMSFLAAAAKLVGKDAQDVMQSFQCDRSLTLAIDPRSFPSEARFLFDRYRQAGLDVIVKAIPNGFGVPTFGAASLETMGFGNVLAAAGFASHADAEKALCGALLELAQSRATDLQGAREDSSDEEKSRWTSFEGSHWLADRPENFVSFQDLGWRAAGDRSQMDYYLDCLAAEGLEDVAVVEFPTYTGCHVVRVLVPGCETWHATAGSSRLGPRIRRYFNDQR